MLQIKKATRSPSTPTLRPLMSILQRLRKHRPPILISHQEYRNLSLLPRYHPGIAKTIKGRKLHFSDSCTLLGAIGEIYEQRVYDFKAKSSTPVVVDCGANIGLASLWFAEHIPNCRVYSYEADPNIFDIMRLNLSSFGYQDIISPVNAALASHSEGVVFSQEGGFSGQIKSIDHAIFKNEVRVPSVTLPQVLSAHKQVDLLKIDVEGAENEFFCGNLDLSVVNNLFLEYHSFEGKPQHLPTILNTLSKNGFRYHIREANPSPHPFIAINSLVGMDLQLNIYAYRVA